MLLVFFNNIIIHTKEKIFKELKMELSKNIFFNTDRLVQNSKVKVSYSGALFQANAENVFIHYGFDNDWK